MVRIMPFAKSVSYRPERLNHLSQWLMALGTRAASPRPVHAEVPIRFADSYEWMRSCTPQEIQALVYFPLSRGAKGLSYGEKRPGLAPESQDMLDRVTRQVVSLRPYLQFADVFPLGSTDQADAEAACLLAGDRALVVLVINHSFDDFDEDHPLVCRPLRQVRTVVDLPPGLRVRSAEDVSTPDQPVNWRQQGSQLVIQTPSLDVVRPYLVHLSQGDAPASAASRNDR
jgi:hypothetical protein